MADQSGEQSGGKTADGKGVGDSEGGADSSGSGNILAVCSHRARSQCRQTRAATARNTAGRVAMQHRFHQPALARRSVDTRD